MEAWDRQQYIFQDNQHSRAFMLKQEFSNTRMRDFPNASTYCQRLKMLSHQLKNIGAPVCNQCLVLQMSNLHPPFYQARFMLTLKETDEILPYSENSSHNKRGRKKGGNLSANNTSDRNRNINHSVSGGRALSNRIENPLCR
ncbi:hypothetical protein Lal_00028642 [Lupinus albus]|nr:hypothetical protein Lal_00028642 [Lupinus albus]